MPKKKMKHPLTPEEIKAFQHDLVNHKVKLIWPEEKYVLAFNQETNIITQALGFEGAFVSDGSTIGDFGPANIGPAKKVKADQKKWEKHLVRVSKDLGVRVADDHYIYQIAATLWDIRRKNAEKGDE